MCRIERWDVRTLRQKKSVRLEGARDVMTHTPDAWVNNDATKINSEVSFTRHSHKPPPLLCWNVPLRLSTERSQGGRAEYGRHFKRKLGALLEGAPA